MTTTSATGAFGPTEVTQLVSSWWFHYDEWDPIALRSLVTEDFSFKCRSDTGATPYEDFIRVEVTGVEDVMAWQEKHRYASPYPLRHNSSNIVVSEGDGSTLGFRSYILVTKIVDGRPYALSSGSVSGSARPVENRLLLSSMEVVLDTRESTVYSEVFNAAT